MVPEQDFLGTVKAIGGDANQATFTRMRTVSLNVYAPETTENEALFGRTTRENRQIQYYHHKPFFE